MRGTISQVATATRLGVIRGPNAACYTYRSTEFRSGEQGLGGAVLFDISGQQARNIHVMRPAQWQLRDWIAFYFSPYGRISRKAYWLRGVLVVLVAGLLGDQVIDAEKMAVASAVLSLVPLWVSAVLAAKRLHDVGHSGWWSIAPFVLMVVAGAVALSGVAWSTSDAVRLGLFRAGLLVGGASALVSLWAYVWAPLWAGQAGYNRFGPDPLRTGL